MTAEPQRQVPKPDAISAATKLLTDALTQQAASHADRDTREARIEQARRLGASDFVCSWQSNDGRDADLVVYYQPQDEVNVIATELVSIDFREPTLPEQLRYESEFEAQLDQGGELWDRVASRIWERSS